MEPRIPVRYFYHKYNGGLFTRISEYIIYRKIDYKPIMAVSYWDRFLGAYTTFSTFGYETIKLLEGGSLLTAGLYTSLTVIIGFAGVALGVGLARIL